MFFVSLFFFILFFLFASSLIPDVKTFAGIICIVAGYRVLIDAIGILLNEEIT